MVLLLQVARTPPRTTRLCGINANSAASAGILLRPRRRGIYAGSKLRHSAAAKELFDARYGNTHRTCPARVAFTLSASSTGILDLAFERADWKARLVDYALCVKALANRLKWASFERFQFCIVDSTERRAE